MEKISFLVEQKNEITNYYIYSRLAKHSTKENSKIFQEIANGEKKHYAFWKKFTKKDVKPNFFMIFIYSIMFRILGLTFTLKFMEKKEKKIEKRSKNFIKQVPSIHPLIQDEEAHEKKLISMINEERTKYIGAIILGLNDALVEITGTLAGLTFALPKASLVGLAGLITGIAASLSMAASDYFSVKAENKKNPFKSSIYTGVTYILTVIFLVLPFFILTNVYFALLVTILFVFVAVTIYNFYVSTVKDIPFKKQFIEMMVICLSVTIITFGIGYLFKILLGISI